MEPQRHRMRQQQRRDSAREWIGSGAAVTVQRYAKRYGVDRYTAYDDLIALGFPLPDTAKQWAQCRPSTPRRVAGHHPEPLDDCWITIHGRMFFVVGYTPGGAPYGMFADEM